MIRVQQEDFDIGSELAALVGDDHAVGGVASFVGIVRDVASVDGHDAAISAMTLEHYPDMTQKKLAEIEAEACARWPLVASLIIHRHGRLEAGAQIMLVACASAHRQAAFEACEFLVDWLKTAAPFWKLEDTDAGEQWVEARASDDDAVARWQEPDAKPAAKAVS